MKALRAVRRRENLYNKIKESQKHKKQLEILVETETGRQEDVANLLSKIGKIERIYELVPFVAIRCDADIAEQLANHAHRESVNKNFHSAHFNLLKQVVSVDVDHPEPTVNPYNSGTPDKQVLTNIIRDKLKDYLRNSRQS